MAVWKKTDGQCWYCGMLTMLTAEPRHEQFCIDHFIAWGDGGTHDLSNLVPACRSCNASKRQRSLEEYRASLARRGLPYFSREHVRYLKELGIPLPPDFPCYPVVTFWFESKGLEP